MPKGTQSPAGKGVLYKEAQHPAGEGCGSGSFTAVASRAQNRDDALVRPSLELSLSGGPQAHEQAVPQTCGEQQVVEQK